MEIPRTKPFSTLTKADKSQILRVFPVETAVTDHLTKQKRSRVMAAVRSTGNRTTELRLAAILRANGLAGWRRRQRIPGKPDFVFRRERLAVFVDGCFWHGCRWHCRMPKSKQRYWKPKILRNKIRGREIRTMLRKTGWNIHRIWEHSLADPVTVSARLRLALHRSARKVLKKS